MEQDSVNVFLSRSFWAPLCTLVVSKAALAAQGYVTLTQTETDAIVTALTVAVIVIVRLVTSRPAHLLKPKDPDNAP